MPIQSPSGPHAGGFSLDGVKRALARRAAAIRWTSIAVILASLVFLMRILPFERGLSWLRSWIDGLGMWGPIVLGTFYILATLLFIPGSLLTLAAGAIYGLALGTVIVSLSSTTGAALAFLISRFLARDWVREMVTQSPKLAAVDEAIGQQGWKIVALMRLSPAVPFNLQNYLYGVTAIRFWPCVLVSWAAMLPGTFMYVYIGSLGHSFTSGRETSLAEWLLRAVGLLATIVVTIYIARLARGAIQQKTTIESVRQDREERPNGRKAQPENDAGAIVESTSWPWGALAEAVLAAASVVLAGWAHARQDMVRMSVERLLGAPGAVAPIETYDEQVDGKLNSRAIRDRE